MKKMLKSDSISDARKEILANRDKGVECPCCKQLVKRYRRKIHGAMAACLIRLYRLDRAGKQYHHIRDFQKSNGGGGDFAKLAHWGLVTEATNDDATKRASGYWKITDLGRGFVLGRETVPRHLWFFNGNLAGRQNRRVTTNIHAALGDRFNYGELMEGL